MAVAAVVVAVVDSVAAAFRREENESWGNWSEFGTWEFAALVGVDRWKDGDVADSARLKTLSGTSA